MINEGNVLIETLPTNALGLPPEIDPTMVIHLGEKEEGSVTNCSDIDLPQKHKIVIIENLEKGLPILHPSVLILTKLKRWVHISTSAYPPSVRKAKADLAGILFLVS